MIEAGRLKPFILHEDGDVRGRVTEYFADSWSEDEELIPLVLEALDRYGPAGTDSMLSDATRFRLTEQSLPSLLAHLAVAEDEDAIEGLNDILGQAALPLWDAQREAIRRAPNVLLETTARLVFRRELAGLSGERLWRMLRDIVDDDEEADYADEPGSFVADDLIEALGRLNVPSEQEVCGLLSSSEAEGGWLELYAVRLAGARRMQAAIPHLLAKLESDDDYLISDAPVALARIGGPEVVRQIRAAFRSGSELFRVNAADTLGRLKHEDSETAILDLLQSERDVTIRTELCFALCKLFSRTGVEVVRTEIAAGYDEILVCLEEELLPVLDVLGMDLPEAAEWRAMREDDIRQMEEYEADFGRGTARRHEMEEWGLVPALDPDEETDHNHGEPIRSQHAKVGRNDSCPCGSGKKYKKCCGRAQQG